MADLSIISRDRIYSDLDFAFRRNPLTDDASIKRDIEAVKQSVLNILLTNRGERPFLPSFGSNIRGYLFENVDSVMIALIKEDIEFSLANYEPRVRVISLDVDDLSEKNAIRIRLDFEIISPIQTTTGLEFTVERLR